MGIITVIYIIAFFILTIILLISIVVLKNERELNKINEQYNIDKLNNNKNEKKK